jgi:hypothetical protein
MRCRRVAPRTAGVSSQASNRPNGPGAVMPDHPPFSHGTPPSLTNRAVDSRVSDLERANREASERIPRDW